MNADGLAAGIVVVLLAGAWRGGRAELRRRTVLRRARTLRPGVPPHAGVPRLTVGRPAPPEVLRRRLAAAAVSVPPTVVWPAWLGVLAASAVAGTVVGGPGLGLVAVGALTGGPAIWLWSMRDRADRRLEAGLPDVLEAVASSVRGGGSLRQAVIEASTGATGPLADDLAVLVADLHRGTPLVEALDDWARRRPLRGVGLAVSALALGAEHGGANARAVDGVAATIRSRRTVADEVRALSSQARLSGLVIALAPLGFGLLAAATDPRTAAFLFRTPLGLLCVSLGLVLDAVAAVWSHHLCELDR